MKKFFKYLGIALLIILLGFVLIVCQLFREGNTFKRSVTSQGKTFYYDKGYLGNIYYGESVTVKGAWNTIYPNSVEIKCDKEESTCTLIQASLYNSIDMLDIYKQDFRITEWNKNYIKATDEGTQYIFEIAINLKNEDVTYTKHPLSKKGVLGNDLETTTFKLYDGWLVDLNRKELEVKKAKWWQTPLTKIIYHFMPTNNGRKIELL